MRLTLKNFGGYGNYSTDLYRDTTVVRPNQSGKTTIVNAYVFAVSGKTLSGFEARHVFADPDDVTEVILEGLIDKPIRRVMTLAGGTTLYVGGDVMTQKAFNEILDVDLAVACANVNILTETYMTAEQLRKLLISADLLGGDEYDELRKEKKRVRDLLTQAEQYALTNVTVPQATCEPLSEAEIHLKEWFEHANNTFIKGVQEVCPCCKRALDAERIAEAREDFESAQEYVKKYREEYFRICTKLAEYQNEAQDIADKQRLVDIAQKARTDIHTYREQLADVEDKLRAIDESIMNNTLPDGVAIITEQVTKSGKVTPTCTLTYNGVPLKSINRGRRIRLCIELLDLARKNKGCFNIPILVDNAESVQGIEEAFDNVIQFKVG